MQKQHEEMSQHEVNTVSDESPVSMIKRIFAVAQLLVKADVDRQDVEASSNIPPQTSTESNL